MVKSIGMIERVKVRSVGLNTSEKRKL